MASIVCQRCRHFFKSTNLTLLLLNNLALKSGFYQLHTSSTFNVMGVPIKMPSLSPTMTEGTIIKWLKNEGDSIQPGDILCDIQTDKAVISFETEEEGILAKILVGNDSAEVKIGTLIALMVAEGEDWKNVEISDMSDSQPEIPLTDVHAAPMKPSKTGSNYGPSVRLLLEKYGLQSDQVSSSGPHGKLLKGDVLKVVKEKSLMPRPVITEAPSAVVPQAPLQSLLHVKPTVEVLAGENFVDLKPTSMRRTIAGRMSQSKRTTAHAYAALDCSIDSLLTLRKQCKKDGISISVNDFIIKAVAVSLTRHPEVNCIWQGDKLVQSGSVDISIAVATDTGLFTPVIRGAHGLGLEEIGERVKDLASRARESKLKPAEFQGGTFTISNLGMFGISSFTAIINPPQCGILAVGGGRLTVDADCSHQTRICATLSYDISAISEDTCAKFLHTLSELLENPSSLLLGSYNTTVDHPLAALL